MRTTMKYLAALFVMVTFVGCGEETTEDIIERVNSTGSITDEQAESLSKVEGYLVLNGLTSLTDEQAESLSKVQTLVLNGLTSITDEQAESLSKVEGYLYLTGLTSITDEQAESLSWVTKLYISEDLQPLIDKYKNQ